MAVNNKRMALKFNKTMISEMLGVTTRELMQALPNEIKEKYKLDRHKAYYFDSEVKEIVQSVKKLATDAEIMALIYPKGIF
jgi:hypothetical protein